MEAAEQEMGPRFGGCDVLKGDWETKLVDVREAMARIDPIACGLWSATFWLRRFQELAAAGEGHMQSEMRAWRWLAKYPVDKRFFPELHRAVMSLCGGMVSKDEMTALRDAVMKEVGRAERNGRRNGNLG